MPPKTINIPQMSIPIPHFHNWKTSVSGLAGLIILALTHQTFWLPLVPAKYVPFAHGIVLICGAIFAIATKDGGRSVVPIDTPTNQE